MKIEKSFRNFRDFSKKNNKYSVTGLPTHVITMTVRRRFVIVERLMRKANATIV